MGIIKNPIKDHCFAKSFRPISKNLEQKGCLTTGVQKSKVEVLTLALHIIIAILWSSCLDIAKRRKLKRKKIWSQDRGHVYVSNVAPTF